MARVLPYRVVKRMVIEYLRNLLARTPPEQRYKPMYVIGGKVLSLADLLREVAMDTTVGRLYVYAWAQQRGIIVK